MTTTKIEPQVCYYIPLSTLAKLSKEAGEAVVAFLDSDLDVSFGDANRTMIDIRTFTDMLNEAMNQQGILYREDDTNHPGYDQIVDVLEEWEHEAYIDLEN